jgi:hypothetical protein
MMLSGPWRIRVCSRCGRHLGVPHWTCGACKSADVVIVEVEPTAAQRAAWALERHDA